MFINSTKEARQREAKQFPIADEDDTPSPLEVKQKQKAKTPLFLEEDSVGDDDNPQPTKLKRKLFVEPEEEDSQRSSAPQKRPDKGKAAKGKAKPQLYSEESPPPTAKAKQRVKGANLPKVSKAVAHTSRTKYKSKLRKQTIPA